MSLDKALARHRHGDLDRAASGYRQVLASDPTCHQALHGLGLLMYQRGRHALATSMIETALKLAPDQPVYYYHLAEVLRDMRHFADAANRYRSAIRLNPSQGDYYFGLGNALTEQGAIAESIDAYRSAVRCAPRDAEFHNNLGNALADHGEPSAAIEHLRKAIALAPDYADAHHNLSLCLQESGQPDAGLEHARHACRLAPEGAEPLLNLAGRLYDSGDPPGAVTCYRQALKRAADDATLLANIGDGLRRANEPGAALKAYRRALGVEPGSAGHRVAISHCLIQLNRFGEAEAESEKALELDSDCASAHSALATCLQVRGAFDRALALLRRALALEPTLTEAAYALATHGGYRVDDDELARWRALEHAPQLSDRKRVHLHFALAKAYEQRRAYDTAFEHYQQANRIKARRYPFDPARQSDYVDRIKKIFSEDFFTQRPGFGLDDTRPIFIVGMPRSGSTLVEQILASHPRMAALGEHLEMVTIVRELPALMGSKQRVPECCLDLSDETCKQLAQRYLASWPDVADATRVGDKMLGNFLRLGVIALMFPRARIMHCTRDPVDTCVSCYTQNFAHGLRFTTDLQHLACFYRNYRSLMEHWRYTLPLPMIDINYETLVDDPEAVSRELVEFCGLPWDDRCLAPHRTQRDVATASLWQARQPVHRQSVGRWRHYEPFLGSLIEGLKPGSVDHDQSHGHGPR